MLVMSEKINSGQIEVFLRDIWAFELLDPQQLSVLARLVTVRRLAREEVLWLQGQRITHFIIVFEGRLRSVRRSSSGAEKKLSSLTRGWHFGLAEMITEVDSTVTLIADRASTILQIDRKSLRQKLLSDAEICYRLMQTMARAIFDLTRELERTSFENVPTRLARLLLKRRSPQTGQPGYSRRAPLEKKISHEELAVQLGVSRESVSRVVADFRKQGLIRTSYRRITVLNPEGLKKYIDYFEP